MVNITIDGSTLAPITANAISFMQKWNKNSVNKEANLTDSVTRLEENCAKR
jgi:hypothetical protein